MKKFIGTFVGFFGIVGIYFSLKDLALDIDNVFYFFKVGSESTVKIYYFLQLIGHSIQIILYNTIVYIAYLLLKNKPIKQTLMVIGGLIGLIVALVLLAEYFSPI